MKTDEMEIGEIYRVRSGTSIRLPSGRIVTLTGQGLWISMRKRLLCRILVEPEDLPALRSIMEEEDSAASR